MLTICRLLTTSLEHILDLPIPKPAADCIKINFDGLLLYCLYKSGVIIKFQLKTVDKRWRVEDWEEDRGALDSIWALKVKSAILRLSFY